MGREMGRSARRFGLRGELKVEQANIELLGIVIRVFRIPAHKDRRGGQTAMQDGFTMAVGQRLPDAGHDADPFIER